MTKCENCDGTGNEWHGIGDFFLTCSYCNGKGFAESKSQLIDLFTP